MCRRCRSCDRSGLRGKCNLWLVKPDWQRLFCASMFHDSTETSTSRHQFQLEQAVREIYAQVLTQSSAHNTPALDLDRSAHVRYLHSGLQRLPSGYVSLDASRPWICYWILQSLALLGAPLPAKLGLTGDLGDLSCYNATICPLFCSLSLAGRMY